ncbi:FUSC family protein [Zhihengliuella sp.]|uniref:FUSC family protein n=1 Tax=Zhihengliuella sp. TaxID=1954483 RepID=UPI00281120F2|nr:FUSC family protein [Zhihengliuella sp.]
MSDPLHWRQLFRLGPAREDHWLGLRCGLGIFLPLFVLLQLDRLDLSLFVVFAAFTGIYGRVVGHRPRLVRQGQVGAYMLLLILAAALAGWYLVEPVSQLHGQRAGIWVAVGLTSVVSVITSVIAGLNRIRPAGSLFQVFAFAAISSLPAGAAAPLPIGEGMLTAGLTVLLSLLLGQAGRLLPHRRTPWRPVQQAPLDPEARRRVWRDAVGYFVAPAGAGIVATLLMPVLGTEFSYWAMVAAVVPLVGQSTRQRVARGVHRVAGTLAGLLLTAGIAALSPHPVATLLLMGLLQFAAEMFILRNYFFAQAFVTPLAILGISLTHGLDTALLYDRLVETVIGSAVGLAVVVAPRLLGRARGRARTRRR